MTLLGVMATDQNLVPGCKFCGAKSPTYASNGTELWHPSVNCCAPSAVLQVTWCAQDLRTIGAQLDAATDPGIRRDLGKVLEEAQNDNRAAIEALRERVRTTAELDAAIAACRALGYDYAYTHARSALYRGTA